MDVRELGFIGSAAWPASSDDLLLSPRCLWWVQQTCGLAERGRFATEVLAKE